MYLAKIFVTHKKSILDPQGEAIKNALHRLDYETVENVSQGKYFETTLNCDSEDKAKQITDSICDSLLANPNMETYRFEIEKVGD
ncbi:phosphoribosylformylglycinamidine synthase subunit PurS [Apilactobacillus sp. TMW 2.2459]|uniref:phosphoribosylformylglycinamidine synthase subunit PurS n=1 Tax=Apilactobacillus xinyiensis TaxID=2841032 RepID=UPI00200F2D80|nr:phosphoribosylformylglycinamidine synthase subunit PurS [Apilactobacillus xinyiensis]MCL0311858.1 phosphoribosylformylglycinamidine synthase subunit PurS [Apilactobacillus xinyiensis]